MGLFTKKDPCAICGGKVKGIFPWKVEGQLVCKECYGTVHLPEEFLQNMTMAEFKEYRAFREQNNVLRQQFQTTEQVDFGFFDDHFLFDTTHGLFCPSVSLDKTIFEGKCVKSFTIREDNELLFEGSAAGLICYNSNVRDRVIAMTPLIQQVALVQEIRRQRELMSDDDDRRDSNYTNYCPDIPKPFQRFVVEIHCDHPYWKILTADMKAPEFSNSTPNVNDYLRLYNDDVALMEKLARALTAVAFPGATEQYVNRNAPVAGQTVAAPAASADVVEEIQRFKKLMEQGILTEEEFAAKKRQLLGI